MRYPTPPQRTHRQRGFTLIEMLIVIVILGIVMALAYPTMQETLQGNRMTSQANTMLAAMHQARSTAIRIGQTVFVCPKANRNNVSSQCGGVGDWGNGWVIYQDTNCNDALNPTALVQPLTSNCGMANDTALLVQSVKANQGINITGGPASIGFRANGFQLNAATATIDIVATGTQRARRLIVLASGAPALVNPYQGTRL
jgi:prepilin-type N-terminal cleavage/methylation domain-containing protein